MLNRDQFKSMFLLVAAVNSKLSGDWMRNGDQFMRANVIEAANAMEYHGWSRTKISFRHTQNFCQGLTEIGHLMLSYVLFKTGGDVEKACDQAIEQAFSQSPVVFFDGQRYDMQLMDTAQRLELLVGFAVSRRICVPLLVSLMNDCDMTWQGFYVRMLQKNLMGLFRLEAGFASGAYVKVWNGREDVEHLDELIDTSDLMSPTLVDDLFRELTSRYEGIAKKGVVNG